MPVKTKQNSGALSPDIFRVLSANLHDKATASRQVDDPALQKDLELIWLKLDERFKSLSQAFIFFDVNCNNRVSYADFRSGLEKL